MTTTAELTNGTKPHSFTDFYIGLGLVISSSGFIGASFIIKKKALIRLQRYGGLRASSGGFGYLREWIWWAGLLSMGIGEAANFVAYAFASASVVTPLGALSILVSAVLASRYLNEKMNFLGKIGCLLCVLGSVMIVLHSPKEEEVGTVQELVSKVKEPGFLIYVLVVVACSLMIIFHFGPLYGKQNIFIYIFLCSLIGSLTIVNCKGLGLAMKETIAGANTSLTNWLIWVFLFNIILCIVVQMNYLNKSLDLFDTTIVTPIYYVLFTVLVIIASAILFKEWQNMTGEDVLGSLCGFFTVIIAIFMLSAFKDVNVQYGNIRQILRPRRDLVDHQNSRWDTREEDKLLARSDSDHEYTYRTRELVQSI